MAIEVFGRMGSMIDTVLNWFASLPWWAQIIAFILILLFSFWLYNQFRQHT